MKNHKLAVKKRLKSFAYAFNGIRILISEEANARIHLLATVCAVIAGIFFKIGKGEWVAVVLAIGFVFSMELINTAIENIADFVSPQKHEKIKKIKDLAAAGVLVSSVAAFVTGLIIFLPKIFSF